LKQKKKGKEAREKEKAKEQEYTYMHASTAIHGFPICNLKRVGDNQVISHV